MQIKAITMGTIITAGLVSLFRFFCLFLKKLHYNLKKNRFKKKKKKRRKKKQNLGQLPLFLISLEDCPMMPHLSSSGYHEQPGESMQDSQVEAEHDI